MQAKTKGTIALDIDGTITHGKFLEPFVAKYIENLIDRGWDVIFLTGRTLSFAWPVLSTISRNFIVVAQNGASIVEMPEKKVISTCTLAKETLFSLDQLFRGRGFGLLVEAGADQKDVCYYKLNDFSEKEREYLDFRNRLCPERWESVMSFDEIPITHFAVGKYFSLQTEALLLKNEIEKISDVKVTVIRDPFRQGYHLALINNAQASKGKSLAKIKLHPPLIVAGDDFNDVSMLELADHKIVMKHATQEIQKMADVIAEQDGIVAALEAILKKC